MVLDDITCYEALMSHDVRFDGAFFVGVASTGIYCRTVCPARTPLKRNCIFYESAAAAEHAGYRPCLRCRPELAPGRAPIDSMSRFGADIEARLQTEEIVGSTVAELADNMGLSDRQLRRIVQNEFGVSPIALAQTQRLHIARRLLTDSNVSITETAFAAGFKSVRRFNALFKERYRLSPTELRNCRRSQPNGAAVRCSLAYRPPLDWDGILHFLELRAIPGVEKVADSRYHRTVSIDSHRGWISVSNDAARHNLVVEVAHSLVPALLPILTRIKSLFDLCAEPTQISGHLGELARANPGTRVPGAFDGFEMAIRAICGQQVTVRGATTLSGRIVALLGEAVSECPVPGLTHFWPHASRVAEVPTEGLTSCGIIGRRAATIQSLSLAVARGELRLEPGGNVAKTMEHMKTIPGIGEWTAEYVAMRALRWPDAFPHSDLGILKAMGTTDSRSALIRAEHWRPWRAYAAIHLWRTLEKKD